MNDQASISSQPKAEGPDFHIIDNRQFSYNDIKRITNDFNNIIGKGGFGDVYFGLLENGYQVAVKMRSHSSSQGVKEFLAEANHLARVHHKNLVTLIGYCIDENCMALVYEYMPEGNLQEKLKADDVRPLTWKQRLRIAYQSALGLEYLHMACNPPLIHRDVKASNILLNSNLEAKIADFGLSRAFESDAISSVSTRIMGSPGYLDPEYFSLNQLSAKSDVYSFGVVLLEIITGQSPTNAGLEGANLVHWVREKLSGGNIQSIVDPKMQEEYDINSIWKVTDLACRCTELTSSKRPTMNAVFSELKESMYLEISTEKMHNENSTEVTDVSQDSTFERSSMGDMPEPGPSVRFLSIDCGLSSNSSYVDPGTNLTYVSDEQFIDTGVNFQISTSLPRVFQTVRSFPAGIRNCYTIRSLTPGFKYLIRATFIYSNYDNLNRPPIFDIYLGVNFWVTVNVSSSFYPEIIVKTTTDYLQVCLVNKNLGNPFISTLHLRQLNSKLYEEVNANQSLIWLRRANLGGSKSISFIRDLSSNNLSGSLPSSLDQLTALKYLDIRGNSQISTNLPFGLQKRQQNGSLTYRFGEIPIPSPSPSPSSKKNIIISTAVVVPLLVIAVVVATVYWLRRKHNQSIVLKKAKCSESSPVTNDPARSDATISHQPKAAARDFQIIDNREFSYNDLKNITNDFKNIIGTGGFGNVYLGFLEDGFQLAVKMRSNSSSARGYCIDENCMALVYEYMQEGNLHEKLKGLEYLHKACNPPLIHRDVKASNILLNANFDAKIADFGLSRAFESDAISHVSTRVIGTPGYLDPEYYSSNQLSGKSDVYSFGVVLLEIVTGQSPTNAGLEGANLVTDLACRCTEATSSKRPTMDAVVFELKESMYLEFPTEKMHKESSTDNLVTDVSEDSAFEIASTGEMQDPGPTVR
ncbi:LRR receptor-like protein kinase [Carex littledalei]|uniref:LRR receptor-like protein kinase n=1 Tax=Carex littledalei TaxID=544730 RepID=A0A833VGG1_9POAL|nr:LRR receptor-like protein kinase [Carex littledalei]